MSGVPGDATAEPTPIPITPRTRTIVLIALVIATILLLRAMPSAVGIFLGAAVLGLIASFPVRLLERFMRRSLAILTTVLVANLLIILAVVGLVPPLLQQLGALIDDLPQYIADLESAVQNLLQPLRDQGILPSPPGQLSTYLQQGLREDAGETLTAIFDWILGFFSGAISSIVHTFLMLLITIYLLVDIDRIKANTVNFAPPHYRADAADLWTKLGRSLSRYLGGLTFSMAEQGALVWLGSWLLGIPYPAVLGVWFGLTAVIPYLGAWLGAIPLVLIAFLSGGVVLALLAIGLSLLVNTFDSNIVQPKVQGHALQVHPILVMLAVIGGGELAGPLGAVFALPVLGMAKVLLDFFAARLVVRAPATPIVITIPGRANDSPTVADGEPVGSPVVSAVTLEQQ